MRSTFSSWYDKKMRATPELSEETDRIEGWLRKIKNIAIVGISRNQHKDSHYVGRYLQKAGYNIFPVNPGADKILGVDVYPDLKSISEKVDAVDVFVKPEYVSEVVGQALEINPDVIWLQLGVGNHPLEMKRAQDAGVMMVQNRCMKVDHQFLIRDKNQ